MPFQYGSFIAMLMLCVYSTRFLPKDGSLLFQNRRDILNTTLLIRINAHTKINNDGSKHKQYLIQLLGNDASE